MSMRKGDKIQITENANYSGQDMAWTEQVTETTILKAGTRLYHFSDAKLNQLLDKKTCFFAEEKVIEGHCYCLILDQDIKANLYSNEVRINLTENMNVVYMGKVTYKRNYDKVTGLLKDIVIKDNRLII